MRDDERIRGIRPHHHRHRGNAVSLRHLFHTIDRRRGRAGLKTSSSAAGLPAGRTAELSCATGARGADRTGRVRPARSRIRRCCEWRASAGGGVGVCVSSSSPGAAPAACRRGQEDSGFQQSFRRSTHQCACQRKTKVFRRSRGSVRKKTEKRWRETVRARPARRPDPHQPTVRFPATSPAGYRPAPSLLPRVGETGQRSSPSDTRPAAPVPTPPASPDRRAGDW